MDATTWDRFLSHTRSAPGCGGGVPAPGSCSTEAPPACEPAKSSWPQVRAPGLALAAERRRARRTQLADNAGWHGEALGEQGFAFSVRDFCATGLQIVARGHDRLRGVGQQLRARLYVPHVVAPISVRLQVRRIAACETLRGPEGHYGVQLEVQSPRARRLWSQALLCHPAEPGAEATPASLAAEGFDVAAPARALAYVTVGPGARYRQVLALRYRCNRDYGLLDPGQHGPGDMADEDDARGRIVAALHHSRVVASVRTFAPLRGQAMGLEAHLHAPERLPPRTELVECARLAIHPDFRGHDLFEALCQLMARYALAQRRRYLVLGAHPKLAAHYAPYGAHDSGVGGDYQGRPGRALLVDLARIALAGKALERRAMYGTPPPLDGAAATPPAYRRTLVRLARVEADGA